jgi:hypothetical protein
MNRQGELPRLLLFVDSICEGYALPVAKNSPGKSEVGRSKDDGGHGKDLWA